MQPRVTVFIPTFNRAQLLRGAIESVLAQTYRDFRLEVSDNASTDDTPAVVQSFDDGRIDYVRQPENLGLLGNHNQFLHRVDTEFSLILPDDDLVGPSVLEETVAALDEHPRAGVVHADFTLIGEAGERFGEPTNWTYGLSGDTVESAAEFLRESMRWSCRICASTALMRTAALPQGGMRATDFPAVDFGLWLRMAADGWDFAFLGKPLGFYRIHGGSHSAAFGPPTGPGYVQGVEIVQKLYYLKRRFVESLGAQHDRRELMRLAAWARRRELVLMTRNLTLPERELLPTLGLLLQCGKVAPDLALDLRAWRLAAASLFGPRIVERLRVGHSG